MKSSFLLSQAFPVLAFGFSISSLHIGISFDEEAVTKIIPHVQSEDPIVDRHDWGSRHQSEDTDYKVNLGYEVHQGFPTVGSRVIAIKLLQF